MNKRILILGILAVLMLVTISFASALNTKTSDVEKKESPLYRIRTRLAVGEKIGQILENIKVKLFGGRIFFVPFKFLLNNDGLLIREIFDGKGDEYTGKNYYSCFPTEGSPSCTYCC